MLVYLCVWLCWFICLCLFVMCVCVFVCMFVFCLFVVMRVCLFLVFSLRVCYLCMSLSGLSYGCVGIGLLCFLLLFGCV